MPSHRYTLTIAAGPDAFVQAAAAQARKSKVFKAWINMLNGLAGGVYRGGQVDFAVDEGTGGVAASNTVTYTAPAGAQTVVIMGRSVAFTAGADATTTAALAVAAINADGIANHYVTASSVAGVVTLKAKTLPGAQLTGNGITLTVTGTGAVAGGATLAGATNATDAGYAL